MEKMLSDPNNKICREAGGAGASRVLLFFLLLLQGRERRDDALTNDTTKERGVQNQRECIFIFQYYD